MEDKSERWKKRKMDGPGEERMKIRGGEREGKEKKER